MSIPVAIFAYRRPNHLSACLAALRSDRAANEADVTIFCDGARNQDDAEGVSAVQNVAHGAARNGGFRSLRVIRRDRNLGLAGSIIGGVTQMLAEGDRVVVVEEDIIAGPWFLTYCADALETYANDTRVASVHAYVYPVGRRLPETFFLRGADCWGWATWRRAWAAFRCDSAALLAEIDARGQRHDFDLDGSISFSAMLRDHAEGKRDTWAARWHASAWLDGMHTLYPGRPLVANHGVDGSGANCGPDDVYAVTPTSERILVRRQTVEEDLAARRAFADFHRRLASPWRRLRRTAARILGSHR